MKLVSPSDPILLGHAEPIEFPNRKLGRTASEMLRFMISHGGVGLAAPQVGIPWRMFTYRNGSMGVVVNPTIVERSPEEIDFREGCLTYPGRLFRTRRSRSITVNYQDLAGNNISKTIDGFLAIIFQHETDHLDGRLVVDHGIEDV